MNHATDLLLIGGIMLLALGAHTLGQRVHVPRVTLLLLVGALAGPSLLDIIPVRVSDNFPLVTELTLAMVGFLLGERMSVRDLKDGREAIIVSLAVTLVTAGYVVSVAAVATLAATPATAPSTSAARIARPEEIPPPSTMSIVGNCAMAGARLGLGYWGMCGIGRIL